MPSLTRSRAVVPRLVWHPSCASTNAELVALEAESEAAEYTTVVTDDQTAGRGRMDRVWHAPAGSALAISVLLRPRTATGERLGADDYGWLPLAAGVAMAETVAEWIPRDRVALKWPNDVLVDAAKVCGVLTELTASGAVVVGAGVNLGMTAEQAPVPTATSLVMHGVDVDDDVVDRVLAGYLARLRRHVEVYLQRDADAESSGLRDRVLAWCTTIGSPVRVELPGRDELQGTAVDVDAAGRLLVAGDAGDVRAVAAGDVTHVRDR